MCMCVCMDACVCMCVYVCICLCVHVCVSFSVHRTSSGSIFSRNWVNSRLVCGVDRVGDVGEVSGIGGIPMGRLGRRDRRDRRGRLCRRSRRGRRGRWGRWGRWGRRGRRGHFASHSEAMRTSPKGRPQVVQHHSTHRLSMVQKNTICFLTLPHHHPSNSLPERNILSEELNHTNTNWILC